MALRQELIFDKLPEAAPEVRSAGLLGSEMRAPRPRLHALARDPGAAKINAASAFAVVCQRQKAVFSVVEKEPPKG